MKRPTPLFFGGVDGSADTLGDGPGPDVYVATAFATEGLNDKGRDYARRYQQVTGERFDLAAALSWDATTILYEALKQAGVPGTKLREQLGRAEAFEATTGPLTFKERQARRPVFVLRWKDGQATLAKTVAPEA